MEQECVGSGREVSGEPPPDRAAVCPVCGREVRVDVQETGHGQRTAIEPHQKVVDVSE
jgi:hypothetical protein